MKEDICHSWLPRNRKCQLHAEPPGEVAGRAGAWGGGQEGVWARANVVVSGDRDGQGRVRRLGISSLEEFRLGGPKDGLRLARGSGGQGRRAVSWSMGAPSGVRQGGG